MTNKPKSKIVISGLIGIEAINLLKNLHIFFQAEIQHHQPHPDHEEELNSEDLLLPWSCCVAQFLAEEEEKERKLNEPEALANTIRHRLMAKNQVISNQTESCF